MFCFEAMNLILRANLASPKPFQAFSPLYLLCTVCGVGVLHQELFYMISFFTFLVAAAVHRNGPLQSFLCLTKLLDQFQSHRWMSEIPHLLCVIEESLENRVSDKNCLVLGPAGLVELVGRAGKLCLPINQRNLQEKTEFRIDPGDMVVNTNM